MHLSLRDELIRSGAICQSTSDTEIILHLMARSQKSRIVERFIEGIRQIEGAYALVCLTNEMLIGARDPVGIRPLVIGRLDDSYILASETCALDIVGATFVREVENGEVVVITKDGLESHRPVSASSCPALHLRVHLLRPPRLSRRRAKRLSGAQGHGPRTRKRVTGRRRCRCADT